MTTEIQPEHDEQQTQPEATEPTRKDRAKQAFKEQRGHAASRTKEWLATEDIDDVDIIHIATQRKQSKHDEKVRQQQRTSAEHHARLAVAKARFESEEGSVSAQQLSRLAGEVASAESKLAAVQALPVLPPTDREINNVRHGKKAGRAAMLVGGGIATLPAVGTSVEQAATGQPLLLAALGTAAGYGWYLVSRPFVDGQPAPAPLIPEQLAAPVDMVKKEPPGGRDFNAPPPPALTSEELEQALRNIGEVRPNEQIQILAVPQRDKDGNTTVVFDLPPRTTVANLSKKIAELAGALGRDASMIDVTKAGTEVRTSLWLTDRDPFEDTRPSPLIKAPGQLDAWKDGVPVAWNKRGVSICLAINNQSFVIAGMTRSGKGVGASNLVVGAAFDPRINLRIVAGKNNGEWDPYAKTGVASTYFKPSPDRLLGLIQALLADKDRREAELGELGKSKMVAPVIEQVGGIEVLVIDELATYTRPGKPLRDEILEGLIELSAVAAGAGIILILITQYPEADVIPGALAMNCGARWAMRVENGQQSNAILGGGQAGAGRDASKFDPPRPGFGWLVNPFAGVTDLARSFDLDEDERGEITMLLEKAAKIREKAGRLAGQWDDPIEKYLLNATGLSSVAGGPNRDGVPGRAVHQLTAEQRQQIEAVRGAIEAMRHLDRDEAQLDEMARFIGGSMTADRLGELLRAAGAGGTVKVTIEGRGRVNGYRREDIEDALKYLSGA